MQGSALALAILTCGVCVGVVACGDSKEDAPPPAARTPSPAPSVELTSQEKQVWAKLPPDRSVIPVLLYHGIGTESDFSNAADAAYGIEADDFAKQMTEIHHAGYKTIDLQTFIDFVDKKPVDLPPRPLLLTFDDARTDSWTGGDAILKKLNFNAVMFVDVGRVDAGNREYLTWKELESAQGSGRWQLQLHSGKGHQQIRYGPGDDDFGPFYAYEEPGEEFDGWQKRTRSDIEWGQATLADQISAYAPLAFAPPYGSYGQDGTNDPKIPDDLLGWLSNRYDAIFTQDVSHHARPGDGPHLGRFQVTRGTTGGELHDRLQPGDQ